MRFVHGHNRRKAVVVDYRIASRREHAERIKLHRLRAEKALGKPLPPKAEVHHADGSIADDAPLVICESHAYHFLLHQRMRVVRAGGNPNTDKICSYCKVAKPKEQFYRNSRSADGYSTRCHPCGNEASKQRYRELRAS